MSDDLISRKALMEEINSLRISITGLRAGKCVLANFLKEYKKSILKCIDEAPTAYDTDEICEKIDNTIANFDCRICPKTKGPCRVCDDDCEDQLIIVIKKIIRKETK